MALILLNPNEISGPFGQYSADYVFGVGGSNETAIIAANGQVTLDGSFNAGGDGIRILGNAGSYTASIVGSNLRLTTPDGADIKIPFGTAGVAIEFADATRTLKIENGVLVLGSQTIATSGNTEVVDGTGGGGEGEIFVLTAGVDTVTGTADNDTINAVDVVTGTKTTNTFGDVNNPTNVTSSVVENVYGTSLGASDNISGGAGDDTLNITGSGAITVAATTVVSGVETANFTTLDALSANVSGWTGLTGANVLKSVAASVTAAATTDVSVTGATGAIAVDGGEAVTVSAGTSNQAITIGATTVNAGTVSVTHSKQGTGAIAIDGGTSVSVTASAVSTGTVSVGQGGAATDRASGVVSVTSTGAAYTASTANTTLGAITITGGSVVTVAQTATSSSAAAAADTSNTTITQSAVSVTAAGATSSVNVSQTAAATAVNAVTAVAVVNETATVTFGALALNETVTIGGLTYTAKAANTAAQVAAAFANLATGATVGANGPALGIYSGSFTAEHSSGAATTTTVVFTGSGAAADLTAVTTDSAGNGNGTAIDNATFGVALVQGTDATAAVTGVMGVLNGAVTISDGGNAAGTDALASVTLNGFSASTIGSDALATLSLSNSDAALTVTNAVTKSLALTVAGYGNSTTAPTLAIGGIYTSLTVNTGAVAASDFTLTGAGLTSLAISGDKALDLNATALAALKTVTVSGAGGLTASGLTSATTTSFDMSASSGANTVTVDATVATYTGGTGADKVTLSAVAPTKSVNLGAGDDILTLAAGTTSATGALAGGDGTDTLVIAAADAATASANGLFEAQISGFERVSLGAVAAGATVDLANLDEISYVTVGAASALLNIDNMATGGTLVLTGANSEAGTDIDVDFVDATGTADSLNVTAQVSTADLDFGAIDISGIESLALTASDTSTSAINVVTLTVTDTALKSVTISGNAAVTLTAGAAVTSINGSAMTGKLTAGSNTVATAITGGAGADQLTANVQGDTLNGGAGNDTLIVGANLVTLTGGAGSDTFDVSSARSNSNSYATIADLSAGDKIKTEAAIANFAATAVSLANTASFGDYVNAAIVTGGANGAAWYQFGGDTYLVHNVGNADTAFTNGTDIIVKIAGSVSLSTAALNTDSNWLVIG